ncbi:preprotein translocase subunit SecG [Marinobacterium sp. AK62]|uniref:Protein-export membrane protein SecG n=1 Tax=Marinobacterium alkalitolerans TaxID=1542925 RepID=A0ABS3ZFE9_9GAMM|nr:preprotein translocase subunit SecG [Marinobacterium alkalitolerans]MBP0049769.1 preprotein translocase subunit SecG [Marinobacterium alkalitolerans]
MESVVLIIHVLLAVAIIALVLLQQGKGAEAGAAFGGGASQTVFGSQGSKSFLGRLTAVVAAGIFATSFALAVFAKQKAENVTGAGIPSAEVIESAAQPVDENELPALETQQAGDKAASDIPVAE